MALDLIAVVGRPNVGKSTLFNRMTGVRQAIVEDTPGVTRDRIFGTSDWNGKYFQIIDTGGFIPGTEDVMEKAIREQAILAIEDADAILFVLDGRDGITKFDEEIAVILRTTNKPVVLAVNKCDNAQQDLYAYEFYKLGLGEPIPISAMSGRGTGEMMDELVNHVNTTAGDENDDRLKIAIVGRPNAGKSSLVNALTGTERAIVTDIPGTTRDSTDTVLKYFGEEIILIDTAGLRRRSQVKENIELYSIIRTSRSIERCDVAIVMLDAERGLEDQDKRIIKEVDEARKGMILAINKWDLIEKDTNTANEFKDIIDETLHTHYYLPVVFTSAVNKQRIFKLIDTAKEIKAVRQKRISTSELNKTMMEEFDKTPPPAVRGQDLRINYITQVGTEPPVFAFFLNKPELLPSNYKRFMERKFREHFDFKGTPISFIFRRKNVSWEDRK